MEVVIAVVVIGIIIFFIIKAINVKYQDDEIQEEKKLIDEIKSIPDFTPTICIEGINNTYVFSIDNERKKILYIEEGYQNIIPYEVIMGVEIIENNVTVSSKSSLRTLGGAILGDLLAGDAGMIVGGLSGDTRTEKKVSSVQVKIKLRYLSTPCLLIDCFNAMKMTSNEEIRSNGIYRDVYWQGLQHAQRIADMISVIIDAMDKELPILD